MKQAFLRIHPKDNVLAALRNIEKGSTINFEGDSFNAAELIPAKHKFTFRDFAEGEEIIMYGVLVGKQQNQLLKAYVFQWRIACMRLWNMG